MKTRHQKKEKRPKMDRQSALHAFRLALAPFATYLVYARCLSPAGKTYWDASEHDVLGELLLYLHGTTPYEISIMLHDDAEEVVDIVFARRGATEWCSDVTITQYDFDYDGVNATADPVTTQRDTPVVSFSPHALDVHIICRILDSLL